MSEHEQMIDDCEKRESKLSDWGRGFIDDLTDRIGDGKSLTQKQAEKLEQIWERVTS